MTEATKLTMVKEYWKHADAGLSDEFAAMQTGFAFYAGNQWSADDLREPVGHRCAESGGGIRVGSGE
jgi:hypothetical protein